MSIALYMAPLYRSLRLSFMFGFILFSLLSSNKTLKKKFIFYLFMLLLRATMYCRELPASYREK